MSDEELPGSRAHRPVRGIPRRREPGGRAPRPRSRNADRGAWAPGWYADPWTAGQYRYWSGQTWTGETNRWGPADAAPARHARRDRPVALDADDGLRAATRHRCPAPGPVPVTTSLPRRGGGAGPLIAGITALVVAVAALRRDRVRDRLEFALELERRDPSSAPFTPTPFIPSPTTPGTGTTTPTTIPRSAISRDPDRHVLADIVVRQSDVARVAHGGADPERESARRADARPVQRHVPERAPPHRAVCRSPTSTPARHPSLSTEAVLYRNPGGVGAGVHRAAQGQRRVPASPGREPGGGGHRATTVFNAPPDGSWPQHADGRTPGLQLHVEHAGDGRRHRQSTVPSIAVYLRRGPRAARPVLLEPERRATGGRRASARSRASSACSKRAWRRCRRRWSTGLSDGSRSAGHELEVELESSRGCRRRRSPCAAL